LLLHTNFAAAHLYIHHPDLKTDSNHLLTAISFLKNRGGIDLMIAFTAAMDLEFLEQKADHRFIILLQDSV
jgi:hypothetical protein